MRRNDVARILLVEDDPFDVRIFERAMKRAVTPVPITVVNDGESALARLRGTDSQPALRRPYLVVLDLNLPGLDGHAVLSGLRSDPALADTLVLVMTTSDAVSDRRQAYANHAAGYLIKTPRQEDTRDAVDFICSFVDLVRLPTA